MSPCVPHMGYTYLNLLDSPKLLQILVTLTVVIKPLLPNFLGRAIVILNFVRRFRNFIADTVPASLAESQRAITLEEFKILNNVSYVYLNEI